MDSLKGLVEVKAKERSDGPEVEIRKIQELLQALVSSCLIKGYLGRHDTEGEERNPAPLGKEVVTGAVKKELLHLMLWIWTWE